MITDPDPEIYLAHKNIKRHTYKVYAEPCFRSTDTTKLDRRVVSG